MYIYIYIYIYTLHKGDNDDNNNNNNNNNNNVWRQNNSSKLCTYCLLFRSVPLSCTVRVVVCGYQQESVGFRNTITAKVN